MNLNGNTIESKNGLPDFDAVECHHFLNNYDQLLEYDEQDEEMKKVQEEEDDGI